MMKAALAAVALVAMAYVVVADDPTVSLAGVHDLSEWAQHAGDSTPSTGSRRLLLRFLRLRLCCPQQAAAKPYVKRHPAAVGCVSTDFKQT